MTWAKPIIVACGLLVFWQLLVEFSDVPPFILPGPRMVLAATLENYGLLASHAMTTLAEMVLGLALGIGLGVSSALLLVLVRGLHSWLLPLLVVSQAVPVFTLAPILVLWLGYGLASKVAMATLIIYFPVTATLYDGLRRTDLGWLDLAKTMNASPLGVLWHVRLPAALPALSSGLKVAAASVPIGAVVGEWVGSSAGLGHLMLHANARGKVDLMFAALFVLAVMALLFYFSVEWVARHWISWQDSDLKSAGAQP